MIGDILRGLGLIKDEIKVVAEDTAGKVKEKAKIYSLRIVFLVFLTFVPTFFLTIIGINIASRNVIITSGIFRAIFTIAVYVYGSIYGLSLFVLVKGGRAGLNAYGRLMFSSAITELFFTIVVAIFMNPIRNNPDWYGVLVLCSIIMGVMSVFVFNPKTIATLSCIIFVAILAIITITYYFHGAVDLSKSYINKKNREMAEMARNMDSNKNSSENIPPETQNQAATSQPTENNAPTTQVEPQSQTQASAEPEIQPVPQPTENNTPTTSAEPQGQTQASAEPQNQPVASQQPENNNSQNTVATTQAEPQGQMQVTAEPQKIPVPAATPNLFMFFHSNPNQGWQNRNIIRPIIPNQKRGERHIPWQRRGQRNRR